MVTTPPDSPAQPPRESLEDIDTLPPGTRFGELEILRVLGVGGFGIVYLAQDHTLERQVALKEYMPGSLAGRSDGQMVSVRSGAHAETYALGLRSFVNEARLLARFNHPSLVKVYRFWEENGTAYMVMPYLQGQTLREARRSMSTPPSEAWIRSVISPLLDALDLLHREDVYHRDIAPDNVVLPPGELPVLLDFGAARRAIGDRTQSFTAILKPSYAPIEQYAEVVQLRQGPWTDLYALGAVVYYLLRGAPPPPATARAVQEDAPMLLPHEHPEVSPQFIDAVDWALRVRPSDRPQNVDALRAALDGRAAVPPRAQGGVTAPSGMAFDRTLIVPRADTEAFAPTQQVGGHADRPAADVTRVVTAPPPNAPSPVHSPVHSPTSPATNPPRRSLVGTMQPPETTVMPRMSTVETPPADPAPSRYRWIAAGLAGTVTLVTVAAVVAVAWGMGVWPTAPAAEASAKAAPVTPLPQPATLVVTPATTAVPVMVAASRPAAELPSMAAIAPVEAHEPEPSSTPVAQPAARPPPVAAVVAPPVARSRPVDRPNDRPNDRPARHAEAVDVRPDEIRAPAPRSVEPLPAAVLRAATPAPVPAPVIPAGPASPSEACGARVFLARALCMEEKCAQPRFKSHQECVAVRAMIQRRHFGEEGD
jgi:serine/threonine protein kinase